MAETVTRDDPFGLDGKVAIVTGGGAVDDGIGNGRAAAILLARAGARVLVVDLERSRAERTVAMIAEEGGTGAAFVADVTDEEQAKAMVAARELAPGDASQYRQHVSGLTPRHPRDEADGGRRRHRQCLVDLGAAAARAIRVLDLDGCGDRTDPGDGG